MSCILNKHLVCAVQFAVSVAPVFCCVCAVKRLYSATVCAVKCLYSAVSVLCSVCALQCLCSAVSVLCCVSAL
eukprot:1160143-Pelagomonas_calceolata.AAC.6